MKSKKLLLLLLIAFFAPWAAMAQSQLNEGFESTTFPPEDWTTIHVSGSNYWARYTTYKHSGDASAYAHWASSGHENYMITPKLAPASGESLSFYVAAQSYSGTTLYVKVSTTTADASAFSTTLATYTTGSSGTIGTTSPGTWVEKTIDLSSYVGQQIFIAFHVVDSNGGDVIIDDVTGVTLHVASCVKPTGLAVEDGVATWDAGTASQWNLQYKKVSDATWTSVTGLTAASYTFSGLDDATSYEVQVQANCGGGDLSDWTSSVTFDNCTAITTFPWTEDFESYSTGDFSVPCWVNEHISGNGTKIFGVSTSNAHGTSTKQLNLPDQSNGTMTKLALPEMTLTTGDEYTFSIDVYRNTSGNSYTSEGVRVYASTDGEIEGATELGFLYRNCEQTDGGVVTAETNTGWYTYEFAIPFTGTCYIVLRGENQYGSATYLDNFKVKKELPCVKPSNPTFVSSTTTSATLSWTNGADTQTAWQIAYSTDSNFDPDEVTPVDVTTNPGTISGLTHSTIYYAYVRANCGSLGYSDWSVTYCQFATACDAITSFPWKEDFEAYSAGDFSHPCWQNVHISGDGSYIFKVYTEATGTNSTHKLQLPDQDDGTLTKLRLPEMNLPSNDYQFVIDVYRSSSYEAKTGEGVRVYASTNGEIEGATELAFIPRLYSVQSGIIPAEATGNAWYTYELPIGMSGTCYIILRGENQYGTSTYMDNFIVEQIPSCPKPTHLAVTQNSVTAHGAIITWTAGGEETDWIVEYADNADFNNASTEPVEDGDPTFTFQGLTAETTYYVRVMADCGDTDGVSLPSDVVSFTTNAACLAPTGLTCTAVTATSATLRWTESGESTRWQICLNDDETNLITAPTNPFMIEQLTAETVYTAKVRGICNGTNTDWSSTMSFEPSAKTVIGSGNGTIANLPTNTYYYNSLTEQIYTVEELGEGGFIESIDFYYNGAERTRHIDVYMVSTDKNQFADNTEWIAVTEDDLVFHGDVTLLQNAWTTITLDDSFLYDGTQNVAIIVDDSQNSGYESGTRTFKVFDATKQSLYRAEDGTNFDPSNPSGGTVGNVKNQIRILKSPLPSCMAPMHVTVTEVTPTGATIAWDKKATQETGDIIYNVTWVKHGEPVVWGTIYSADRWNNDNPPRAYPSPLDSETEYDFYVRRKCGENEYSEEVMVTFTTLEGCPAPTNVEVSNINHTSADVAWTGYSDNYDVYLGTNSEPTTLLSVDFDNQTIPATWTNDATYPWTTVEHGEGYCMQSTIQGKASTVATITATVTYPGNGTIAFDALCQGEGTGSSYFDVCDFYIDETRKIHYGAQVSGWNHYEFDVTAGEHTFTWSYSKDSSVDKEGDAFSVDNIVMTYKDVVWGEPVPVETAEHTFNTLTPGTDYYVKVQGFCDETPSEESEVVTFNAPAYKHFVTEGNWNVATSWEPEGLPETGDDVFVDAPATIPAGYLANVGHVTLGTNGAITIADGGQLRHTNAFNDAVTVALEKEITGYGTSTGKDHYYLIAPAPFSQTLSPSNVENMLTNEYDLYSFSAAAQDGLEWINQESYYENYGQSFKLRSAHGYLYANSATVTLKSTGPALSAANGGASLNIQYNPNDDYEFNGWELAGNPFVCNGYVYITINDEIVETDFYKMNTAGDGYTEITSADPLKPYEGVFVYFENEQQCSYAIKFSPDPIQSSNNSKLNMNLSHNGQHIDMARVRFGEGQNLAKMSFRENSSQLYIPQNGKDYAMVFSEGSGTLPVCFKAENNGTYTLSFTNEEMSFAYLHLIDNMTGIETDLLANPSYSFEARTTDYESRFKLVFATGNNANDDTFAFFSNGSFVINNEGEATLQVIDVNGRILKNESINGCANVNVKAAAGVYVLRLVNGNDVKVQKVVVK